MLLCGRVALAQNTAGHPGTPGTINNMPQRDTNSSKTNTGQWKTEEARMSYEKLGSAQNYGQDSGLHTFHRNRFLQPWYRDLGNLGAPALNLLFTSEYRVGPQLGYHIYDVYRFNIDSLNYYNTTRPYSMFSYQLGSKLEQCASLLHTQNIKPNWNIAVDYRKVTSQGFYKIQRNNHDAVAVSTNYQSLNKHYILNAGAVYNKMQHDENGGILSDSLLMLAVYADRRTVSVPYESSYSTSRSSISNVQRDFTAQLQHSYIWGRTDTAYNSDSTQYTYTLRPRFSITHKLQVSTEKHTFKDLAPDSMRYVPYFNVAFDNDGTGYYQQGGDSVFVQQKWFWVDNQLLLNGFIGKDSNQLVFNAGIGNRYDQFLSTPAYNSGNPDRSKIISNYLTGEIKKEALTPSAWEYGANTRFYLTGDYAGNFSLNAYIGKKLRNNAGGFKAGFTQQLGTAPYSFSLYENRYVKLATSFNKESVTALYATLESPRLRASAGIRDYVIGNYIYIDQDGQPSQYTVPFTILQAWGRKVFKVGSFYLDNELVYQQLPANAPVNVPTFMGRHQLSFENNLFKSRLKVATGVEVRYNTEYHPSGYNAILNKFYYQNTKKMANTPEMAVFLNFRVKRFRAFIMGDNLQQLFARNAILFTGLPANNFDNRGINYNPVYAAPDLVIRFGFSWIMIN